MEGRLYFFQIKTQTFVLKCCPNGYVFGNYNKPTIVALGPLIKDLKSQKQNIRYTEINLNKEIEDNNSQLIDDELAQLQKDTEELLTRKENESDSEETIEI